MSKNKQTVQQYIDGFLRSDHAKELSCLHDDVSLVVPGVFSVTGKEAFDKEIENENFVGRPTIEITSVKSAMKNGALLDAVFCDVFQMQDGKIKQLTSYLVNR